MLIIVFVTRCNLGCNCKKQVLKNTSWKEVVSWNFSRSISLPNRCASNLCPICINYVEITLARKVVDNETNGSRFNSFAVQAIIRKKRWTVVREEIKSQAFINLVADCLPSIAVLSCTNKIDPKPQLYNGTQIHEFIILAV